MLSETYLLQETALFAILNPILSTIGKKTRTFEAESFP